MRSRFLFLAFVLISGSGYGQLSLPLDTSGKVNYRKILSLDSTTKKEIFDHAWEWCLRVWRDEHVPDEHLQLRRLRRRRPVPAAEHGARDGAGCADWGVGESGVG